MGALLTTFVERPRLLRFGRVWAAPGFVLACLCSGLGCTGIVDGEAPHAARPGQGNGGTNSVGGMSSTECSSNISIPTRLARIGDPQLANAIGQTFGSDAEKAVGTTDPASREFFSIQDTLSSSVLDRYVQNAEAAMNAVTDATLMQLGGCTGGSLDEACAQQVLGSAAEKFYRRPLTADESASLQTVYSETSKYGVGAATRAALRAILTAPPVIYRTEFGSAPQNGATKLTPYEVASELSFMLADTLPDAPLLAAAKAGALATREDIAAQVDRLLATPAVQANLTRLMLADYGIGSLFTSAKDTGIFGAYTKALQNSMYTETKLFVDDVLWHGKMADLLTSPKTFIDESLAALYGVTYPGGGGFQPFTFPAGGRAGLLTQASLLSIAANPDNTSVVHRGLFVHAKLMCLGMGAPPATLAKAVNDLAAQDITEKAKAEVRANTGSCSGCHLFFDQYGLTMEHYDAIGRYRDAYPDGTPIDASVTLPEDAGGTAAQDVTEMSAALAANPIFGRCVVQQLTGYGLGFQLDSNAASDCGIRDAYERFASGSGSFSELVREVAVSDALLVRKVAP